MTGRIKGLTLEALPLLSLVMVLKLCCSSAYAQSTPLSLGSHLTTHEIVKNLEDRDIARAQALHRFEGTRVYNLHYRGFPHDYDAEMVVNVTFQAPARKEFTVVSQSGSRYIVEHVFKRMLDAEKEATEEQSRTALNEQNYQFVLLGYETSPDGSRYVLSVTPKSNNRFLYRGLVWVDATDFAAVKIEVEPGQNPSFWIKRSNIQHSYRKIDGFWLPAENHSQSFLRIGGRAELAIDYRDYKITQVDPMPIPQSAARDSRSQPLDGRFCALGTADSSSICPVPAGVLRPPSPPLTLTESGNRR
jgi:hypothetical protein